MCQSQNEFLQTREEQISELHTKVESLQKFQSMVEGATQTSDSLIQLPSSSVLSLTGEQLAADIPDAPTPPPPPPVPFGEQKQCIVCLGLVAVALTVCAQ